MNDSWNDALKKKYSHCGGSGIENVCVSVFYKLFHLLIHPPHFPPKNTSTPACANHITNRCKSIHFTNCQSTDKWSSIYLLYIQPTQGGLTIYVYMLEKTLVLSTYFQMEPQRHPPAKYLTLLPPYSFWHKLDSYEMGEKWGEAFATLYARHCSQYVVLCVLR